MGTGVRGMGVLKVGVCVGRTSVPCLLTAVSIQFILFRSGLFRLGKSQPARACAAVWFFSFFGHHPPHPLVRCTLDIDAAENKENAAYLAGKYQ